MRIIIASGNKGKIKEVRNIFSNSTFEIISLEEIGYNEEIEENGNSFEENAFIKADTIYNKYKLPVIADDSGLSVEQLNGNPGVYSARYAGENATYDDNNKKLISELENLPKPHLAKFNCYAVYVDDKNRIAVSGELPGEIISEYKGSNGFGYDPIFKVDGYIETLAEMSLEDKNKISHRAKAFEQLKEKLENITSQQ